MEGKKAHRRRDEVVVGLLVYTAKARRRKGHALHQRHGCQLQLVCHVAERPDMWHICALQFIDRHAAALLRLYSRRLQYNQAL